MTDHPKITIDLVSKLNYFSLSKRVQALEVLIAEALRSAAEQEVINLHCHTFFPFNAYGYSPIVLEELKAMPAGAIWDYYCLKQCVPVGVGFMSIIKDYEKKELSKRI